MAGVTKVKIEESAEELREMLKKQKTALGKERIQEFFNCVGILSHDDVPILKRTKSYVEAISALVLKLENKFIRTHPTLQSLFLSYPL